jgi:Tfp pilus assembly protein PilN
LIIDIEPGSFTIIVVTKGVPQIIRTIALSQGRVSREEIIRYLGDEIERTVKFYNSTHPRDPLPSIPLFFTGELADDPAIPKSVAAKTQLPLEPPKPPLSSPPDLSLHKYGVNIGLALREMRLPKAGRPQAIDFDILPEAYKLKRSNRQALLLFLILVGFVPLLPISQIPSSSTFSISFPSLYEMNISEVARTAALRHKLDVLNQKLQERIIENKEIAEIGTAIERTTIKAESLRRCLDDLATQRNNFLESMRSVTIKALTSGISLTSISESHGGIKLEGEAESFDAVLDYAQALRETERFYTVWVKSLGEKAENVVSFNIEVNE